MPPCIIYLKIFYIQPLPGIFLASSTFQFQSTSKYLLRFTIQIFFHKSCLFLSFLFSALWNVIVTVIEMNSQILEFSRSMWASDTWTISSSNALHTKSVEKSRNQNSKPLIDDHQKSAAFALISNPRYSKLNLSSNLWLWFAEIRAVDEL